jgi:hypothetical protein
MWPLSILTASTSSPIGRSASTLPFSVLVTINFWGFRHPISSCRFSRSIVIRSAATGQRARTFLDFRRQRYFVLVQQIQVDFASPVGRQELRGAAQIDRRIDFSALEINVRLIDISTPLSPSPDTTTTRPLPSSGLDC